MKTKKTLLALSPKGECILLAAQCRQQWTDLLAAGSHLVENVLEKALNHPELDRVIVMVYRVERPAEVHLLLEKLEKQGKTVIWCCPRWSPSVPVAFQGLSTARLVTGTTMQEAVEKAGLVPTASKALGDCCPADARKDLDNYLDYKISMALFSLPEAQHMIEAAQYLADLWSKKGKFSLKTLPSDDAASVKRFAENRFPYLAGYSTPIQELKKRIIKVGPTDLSVLVLGETGTGKENVACYLHEFSPRRGKPLVVVNCAGLTETFLRSELFGHTKGAYTGADADKDGAVAVAEGGTLFLDEVAEMPLPVQAALLRFLQNRHYVKLGESIERKADIRVIAATQPVLEERIVEGKFRADLYYRLAEVTIMTPALRDIPGDIGNVIDHMVFSMQDKVDERRTKQTRDYFRKGKDLLSQYPWPGNVRQLRALVRRKLMLDDDVLAELTPRKVTSTSAPVTIAPSVTPGHIRPIDDVLHEYVKDAFQQRGDLTQKELAAVLGKSVNTVKKILRT